MIKWILLLLLVCGSCAPTGPMGRIQANHQKFAALDVKEQELVRQGKIGPKMSMDAVFLAWGKPAHVATGSKDGKPRERWDYSGTRAVFMNSLGSDCYWPYGYRHRYGYPYDPFYGPDIAYVPYRRATVWFIDGKVDAWESVQE